MIWDIYGVCVIVQVVPWRRSTSSRKLFPSRHYQVVFSEEANRFPPTGRGGRLADQRGTVFRVCACVCVCVCVCPFACLAKSMAVADATHNHKGRFLSPPCCLDRFVTKSPPELGRQKEKKTTRTKLVQSEHSECIQSASYWFPWNISFFEFPWRRFYDNANVEKQKRSRRRAVFRSFAVNETVLFNWACCVSRAGPRRSPEDQQYFRYRRVLQDPPIGNQC